MRPDGEFVEAAGGSGHGEASAFGVLHSDPSQTVIADGERGGLHPGLMASAGGAGDNRTAVLVSSGTIDGGQPAAEDDGGGGRQVAPKGEGVAAVSGEEHMRADGADTGGPHPEDRHQTIRISAMDVAGVDAARRYVEAGAHDNGASAGQHERTPPDARAGPASGLPTSSKDDQAGTPAAGGGPGGGVRRRLQTGDDPGQQGTSLQTPGRSGSDVHQQSQGSEDAWD